MTDRSHPSGDRRVWHVAPSTYGWVIAFMVVAVVGLPTAAWFIWQREASWPLPAALLALAVVAVLYGWRFGLHPRLVATSAALVVVNPFRTRRLDWSDVVALTPGQDGLVVTGTDQTVEAWCVQTTRRAQRSGRTERVDALIADLLDHVDAAAPTSDGPALLRRARPHEAASLMRLERDTNLVALAEVFPAADHPYPEAEVTARWRRLLADPGVRVMVAEATSGRDGERADLVGLVAYDHTSLRHLAVRPEHAGAGIGTQLHDWACEEILDDLEQEQALLWVLELNTAAREFYDHRGWEPTGDQRTSEYPPHPVELQLRRRPSRRARRGA